VIIRIARGEDEGGVRDGAADAAWDQPQPGVPGELRELFRDLARDVDREIAGLDAVLVEQRRQRHEMELRRDDELEPSNVERSARTFRSN
jgi:hypothetical protein